MTDKELLELIGDLDAALRETEDTKARIARALEREDTALARRHLEAIEASLQLRERLECEIAETYAELEGPTE